MPNVVTRKAGPLTAAPPPSLTESQRRLLADTLSLGEAPSPDPFASWTLPCVLPDPDRVKRVIGELDRGLQPTRPEFLKWICDKLSALPSQTATGVNAALWTDNVVDVCEGYPEDLLQAACLEVLKTKTFRPSPAEIVKLIEPKHAERQRMLARARKLLPGPKAAAEVPRETLPERLRGMIASYRKFPQHQDKAARYERELAAIEEREPEAWAMSAVIVAPGPAPEDRPPFTPDTSPTTRRLAALAHAHRTGKVAA